MPNQFKRAFNTVNCYFRPAIINANIANIFRFGAKKVLILARIWKITIWILQITFDNF